MAEQGETGLPSSDFRQRPGLDVLVSIAHDFPITPSLLKRIHTLASDGRQVTLGEYVAALAPIEVAEKLGIQHHDDPTIERIEALDQEALRKITLETCLAIGDRGVAMESGDRSAAYDESIWMLKNNSVGALKLIEMQRQSLLLMEKLIEKGKVRLEEDDT